MIPSAYTNCQSTCAAIYRHGVFMNGNLCFQDILVDMSKKFIP